MKKHILNLLVRIGLTEKEANFYLTANQNQNLTIKDLKEKSGLSLASTYRAFDKLKTLGLVTSSQENWRKSIEAVSLKTLANKLAKEQRKLRKVELELKKYDNLMNLTSFSDFSEPVEVLSDQNKIVEKCFEILSRPWENMLVYGSAERLIDVIGNDPEREFKRIRAQKGKSCTVVLTEVGPYASEFMPNNEKDLRNVKIKIDRTQQDYMTYVYDDEAIVWKMDENVGNRAIVIRDPALVGMNAQFFNTVWQKV